MKVPDATGLSELIRLCKSGDASAQYKIYKLFADQMLNSAHRITGNRADAEDALQDAFVKAFRNIRKVKEPNKFAGWLKKIVVNSSIDILKKSQREKLLSESVELNGSLVEEEVDDVDSVDTDIIYDAIQKLPSGYRAILSLYILEGYDHEEIAGIMGIAKSTSISQYHRAKKKLRDLINYATQKRKAGGVDQESKK